MSSLNLNDRVALNLGRMVIQLHEKEIQLEQSQKQLADLEAHLTASQQPTKEGNS